MNHPPDHPRCCILIPCLNEAGAIRGVLESVLKLGLPVVVIDDGSDDGTADIVRTLPVVLIRHTRRMGKGEALREGFHVALEAGFDGVLTMDGDGQHSAEDIPRLLQAAMHYPHHIITGARLINRERQPVYRRMANDFADWGISWACGQRIVDTQSGQRYYPHEALELADIPVGGFVFESDILIEAAWQRGVRVASVAIESRYEHSHHRGPRTYRVSHFRPVTDFVRITAHVVGKVIRAGFLWDNRRRMLAEQAQLINDCQPSGLLASSAREHSTWH